MKKKISSRDDKKIDFIFNQINHLMFQKRLILHYLSWKILLEYLLFHLFHFRI